MSPAIEVTHERSADIRLDMSETLPDGPRFYLPFLGRYITRVTVVITGGFFLLGLLSFRLEMVLLGILTGLVFSLTVALFTYAALVVRNRSALPRTIALDDGVLTVESPDQEESVKIADCRWSRGDSWQDNACIFLPRRECLLLELPGGEQVACGLTPETRGSMQEVFEHFRLGLTPHMPVLEFLLFAPLFGLVGAVLAGGSPGCSRGKRK